MARPFKQVALKDVKELIAKSFSKIIDEANKSTGKISIRDLIKARNSIIESL